MRKGSETLAPQPSWWGAGWVSSSQARRACRLTPSSALSHLSLQSCAQAPESSAWSLPQTHVLWALFQTLRCASFFGLALIMVTRVGPLCPTHTCHGSFYLACLSLPWGNRSLRLKTYFSFLFPPKYLLHLFLPLIPSSNLLSVIPNTVPLVSKCIRTMMMTVMGSSLSQIETFSDNWEYQMCLDLFTKTQVIILADIYWEFTMCQTYSKHLTVWSTSYLVIYLVFMTS